MGSAERVDPERSLILRPTRTEALKMKKQQSDPYNLGALKDILFAGG